ncbi:MAG: hypothetical protein H6Q90_5235 [Deltaproteobacteria bacterium]|nr:hypothetical protein [Deltaproteobacteria bacterium]
MTKRWMISAALCTGLCAGLAAACGGGGSGGGGSGVATDKQLINLQSADVTRVCAYLADVAGPARMVDCGGGNIVTIGGDSTTECETDLAVFGTSNPNCTATVGQAEDCFEALAAQTDAQLCSDSPPPAACSALFGPDCN